MPTDDGGRFIPQWMEDGLIRSATEENVYRCAFPKYEPPKPLTIRERLAWRVWDLRYRIARVVYPPMDERD